MITDHPNRPKTRTHKKLSIAAAVLATGALLGTGVGGAMAATPSVSSTSVSSTKASRTTPSSTAVNHAAGQKTGAGMALAKFLRADLATGPDATARAHQAAAEIVDQPAVLAKLPANLQTELRALKSADPADAAADASTIKTISLGGGYGARIEALAKRVQTADAHPMAAGLRMELRAAFNGGADSGQMAQKAATTLIDHPKLFAKLPASLQTELKILKSASPAQATADVLTIKTTALDGGYGPRIQKIADRIQSNIQGSTNGSTSSGAAVQN